MATAPTITATTTHDGTRRAVLPPAIASVVGSLGWPVPRVVRACASARTALALSLLTLLLMPLYISPAHAAAPTSASCVGQFFSSHAGLAAQHTEPRNVGEFISAAAQQLGNEFGASISGARNLPREDCGL